MSVVLIYLFTQEQSTY